MIYLLNIDFPQENVEEPGGSTGSTALLRSSPRIHSDSAAPSSYPGGPARSLRDPLAPASGASDLPQLSPRGRRPGQFFAENHGEIHGENHGTVMANDINILYDHTCGGCFLVRHLNWWVLYDLYIYMDQTWGPNGPLKLGVWKIGHGLYDCPSLIHYRGSMNQKTGMLVDIPWYTLWLCQNSYWKFTNHWGKS